MVSERNRSIKKYLEALGIEVNICKNKARGNKGFFKSIGLNKYRIDISNNVSDDEISEILVHEFAHYMHYTKDKNLNSLDFIFDDFTAEIEEELINITVKKIPKDYAYKLISARGEINDKLKKMKNKNDFFSMVQKKELKRAYSRISSKIFKLNKYYQSPTELFARFLELYFTNCDVARRIAPNASKILKSKIDNNVLPELTKFYTLF